MRNFVTTIQSLPKVEFHIHLVGAALRGLPVSVICLDMKGGEDSLSDLTLRAIASLGHSDINTTALYLHFLDTRRREAVRKISYTVPVEILPVSPPANETETTSANVPLPPLPEPFVSSHPIDLDEQHGLDDIAA